MYPSLFRRIAATAIDIAVVVGVFSLAVQNPLLPEAGAANLWAAAGFAVLYEPVLTVYACTLGQALMRTRVRHVDSRGRITLGKSYVRFRAKYVASILAGATSGGFVRISPRKDLRALHDRAADTVVVDANAPVPGNHAPRD